MMRIPNKDSRDEPRVDMVVRDNARNGRRGKDIVGVTWRSVRMRSGMSRDGYKPVVSSRSGEVRVVISI